MGKLLTPIRIAIALGAALAVLLVGLAIAGDVGEPSVPSGDVASVDGKGISQDDFDKAFTQAAAAQQAGAAAPKKGTPQYDTVRDQAMNNLLDVAWIEGEAADRGITVSDREVQQKLEELKSQNFKTEAEYQKFLKDQNFTEADVLERAKVQLLAEDLQKKIADDAPPVSSDDVHVFYDNNSSQFASPETRDVRYILNEDKAKADKAYAALQSDDSDASWAKVAKTYSTDDTTKAKGGLREGLTQGVLPEPVNKDIFDASVNSLQAPVKTQQGYYVFDVVKINAAGTRPFDDVSKQIQQQLEGQAKQDAFTAFLEDYRAKWTDLTVCADGYIIDRCDNFPAKGPTACESSLLKSTGCAAPVNARILNLPDLGGGGPQRPHPPGDIAPQTAPTTPGALPPGATSAPSGSAPPQPGG